MRRSWAFVLAVAPAAFGPVACDSFEADAHVEPVDPTPESGSPGPPGPVADGSFDAPENGEPVPAAEAGLPRCDVLASFGAPEVVPSLNVAGRHSVSARPSGAHLYFASDRAATTSSFEKVDIYRADVAGDAFITPVLEPTLSSPDEDVSPTESEDHLTIFLARGTISSRRIYRSQRPNVQVSYPIPQALSNVPLVAGSTQESDPYLVGARLYFTSEVADRAFVYVVEATKDGAALTPRVVARHVGQKMRYPVVNRDETELFFVDSSSEGKTVYRATRALGAEEFTNPVAQPTLQVPSSANLEITGLSADACDLYLSARPTFGDSRFVIHRARRPKS
jgi:hypothetical protein